MAPREPTTEDEQWLRKVRLGPAEAPFREAWLGDERLNWLSASSLEALLVQGDQDVLDTLKAKVEPLAVRGLIAKLTGRETDDRERTRCRPITSGSRSK